MTNVVHRSRQHARRGVNLTWAAETGPERAAGRASARGIAGSRVDPCRDCAGEQLRRSHSHLGCDPSPDFGAIGAIGWSGSTRSLACLSLVLVPRSLSARDLRPVLSAKLNTTLSCEMILNAPPRVISQVGRWTRGWSRRSRFEHADATRNALKPPILTTNHRVTWG